MGSVAFGCKSEAPKDVGDGDALADPGRRVMRQREDLPDPVTLPRSPGSEGHELRVAKPLQRVIDTGDIEAQRDGHLGSAEEGRSVAIRSKRQQHEDSDGVGTEIGEPAVVQETVVEPAKASDRSTQEPRMGWLRWRASHDRARRRLRLAVRAFAFSAARSLASLAR